MAKKNHTKYRIWLYIQKSTRDGNDEVYEELEETLVSLPIYFTKLKTAGLYVDRLKKFITTLWGIAGDDIKELKD